MQQAPTSAYEVIDKAIHENRAGEVLIYFLSTVIVAGWMFALIYGVLQGEALIALSGGIADTVIFPAVWLVRDLRRQNLAIRLMEASIKLAHTPEEAAQIVNAFKNAFEQIFVKAKAS